MAQKEVEMPDFDLLVEVDGKKKRIPSSQGIKMERTQIIGIFPFKDDSTYLELEETEECLRKTADKTRTIPEQEFWEKVYAVRHQLNAAFSRLEKPQLSGYYFTIGSFFPTMNWIVSMDDNMNETISNDYYPDNEMAKFRYCGKF